MQSLLLVSFCLCLFFICQNAVAFARVIFYVFKIKFSWQNYENILEKSQDVK